jgi:medium-chain acyl-[acyl-carrier-protein] hydrolase
VTHSNDQWVEYADDPGEPVRLFCIPYAGGGPQVFGQWRGAEHGFAVASVRLPGRGDRLGERLPDTFGELLPALAGGLAPHLDRPYALFGHSAGARIAFELAHFLLRTGGPAPLALFASGARPPHRIQVRTLYNLSDRSLCAWLIAVGGMPPSLLEDHELAAAVLPTVRADLLLLTDPSVPRPPLTFPVRAYVGADDSEAPMEVAEEWRLHTSGTFSLRTFRGGHFFLRAQHREILADVGRHLRSDAGRQPRADVPDVSGPARDALVIGPHQQQ